MKNSRAYKKLQACRFQPTQSIGYSATAPSCHTFSARIIARELMATWVRISTSIKFYYITNNVNMYIVVRTCTAVLYWIYKSEPN